MDEPPFIDQRTALLAEFLHVYASGNPTALHEVMEYCAAQNLPLPKWAKEEIQRILKLFFFGKTEVKMGRHARKPKEYKRWMDDAIRQQAYLAVRKWQQNPNYYDDMPTRALQLWYDGKITHTKQTKEYARFVTCEGLMGTSHHCSEERLRKLVLEWKSLNEYSSGIQNEENGWQPLSEEEYRNSHMIIGLWKSEVDYGMRKDHGQIFGPPSAPPKHILELLEEYNKSSPNGTSA